MRISVTQPPNTHHQKIRPAYPYFIRLYYLQGSLLGVGVDPYDMLCCLRYGVRSVGQAIIQGRGGDNKDFPHMFCSCSKRNV